MKIWFEKEKRLTDWLSIDFCVFLKMSHILARGIAAKLDHGSAINDTLWYDMAKYNIVNLFSLTCSHRFVSVPFEKNGILILSNVICPYEIKTIQAPYRKLHFANNLCRHGMQPNWGFTYTLCTYNLGSDLSQKLFTHTETSLLPVKDCLAFIVIEDWGFFRVPYLLWPFTYIMSKKYFFFPHNLKSQ